MLYGDIYQLSIHKTLYACIIAFYDTCITYAALILMLRRLVDVPKMGGLGNGLERVLGRNTQSLERAGLG